LGLLRLSDSVASGLVLYFECSTKDARRGAGTCCWKCNALMHTSQKSVAVNHTNIRLSRKSTDKINSQPRDDDDDAGVVEERLVVAPAPKSQDLQNAYESREVTSRLKALKLSWLISSSRCWTSRSNCQRTQENTGGHAGCRRLAPCIYLSAKGTTFIPHSNRDDYSLYLSNQYDAGMVDSSL
jgi:hypothetical protein